MSTTCNDNKLCICFNPRRMPSSPRSWSKHADSRFIIAFLSGSALGGVAVDLNPDAPPLCQRHYIIDV